ncbi:unnamed protein product, partial [Allacma fusca]
LKVSL